MKKPKRSSSRARATQPRRKKPARRDPYRDLDRKIEPLPLVPTRRELRDRALGVIWQLAASRVGLAFNYLVLAFVLPALDAVRWLQRKVNR